MRLLVAIFFWAMLLAELSIDENQYSMRFVVVVSGRQIFFAPCEERGMGRIAGCNPALHKGDAGNAIVCPKKEKAP